MPSYSPPFLIYKDITNNIYYFLEREMKLKAVLNAEYEITDLEESPMDMDYEGILFFGKIIETMSSDDSICENEISEVILYGKKDNVIYFFSPCILIRVVLFWLIL